MPLFTGTNGDDTLDGGGDDDTLDGGLGNDVMNGGAGNDLFVTGVGNDTLDGGDGLDTVSLANAAGAWQGTVGSDSGDPYLIYSTVVGAFDDFSVSGIEAWRLTSFADHVSVTGAVGMQLFGLGGNDTLVAGAADDRLDGGDDDDLLRANIGTDTVVGGAGIDTLSFAGLGTAITGSLASGFSGVALFTTASEVEIVIGTSLADAIAGDAGSTELRGGNGADTLTAGDGNDSLYGEGGNDTLVAGVGTQYLDGGGGQNTLDLSALGVGVTVTAFNSFTAVTGAGGIALTSSQINRLIGTAQADAMSIADQFISEFLGGAGNDTIDGGGGLSPSLLDYALDGGEGDDVVTGGGGSDTLHASTGNDVLNAGDGYDTLSFERLGAGASVDLQTGSAGGAAGSDTVSGFEVVTGSAFGDTLLGSDASGDSLGGQDGDDALTGRGGNDVMNGDAGNDTLAGGLGADYLGGGLGNDSIDGGAGNDYLSGGTGDDLLTGGDGNDVVDAMGGGSDIAFGGAGDDTVSLAVDAAVDQVEGGSNDGSPDLGVDTLFVEWSVDAADPSAGLRIDLSTGHVRQADDQSLAVVLGFEAARAFVGDDTVIGNDGDNWLSGQGGADTISGGAGSDTVLGGEGLDFLEGGLLNDGTMDVLSFEDLGQGVTVDLDQGTASTGDQFFAFEGLAGGSGDDRLRGDAFANRLLGNDGDDVLYGRAGNDTLEAGAGEDILVGGAGDDTYVVFDDRVLVVETGTSGGVDTVQASVTVTLAAFVERLELLGDAAFDGIGNELANRITGNAAANTLTGGAGNDTLDGGAAGDTLVGGSGADSYLVDSTLDRIDEATTLAGEIDTVTSRVNWTLGANLEKLVLGGTSAIAGTGNTLANTITGNGAANTLTGGAGNDTLDGGAGGDSLVGGSGGDVYLVDSTLDRINETSTSAAEVDTVTSRVTWTLGANLEKLVLAGTSALSGTGNTLANTLTGNGAANTLDGKAGKDVLTGGLGADSFRFTTALNATTNVDRLADFRAVDDRLQLDDAVFKGIGAVGALAASAFVTGTRALDAGDRIVYNKATGQLFFDADGSGAGAAVLFATVTAGTTLTAADVFIV
jgi:Ca2+-binding RTX toxin-like protein